MTSEQSNMSEAHLERDLLESTHDWIWEVDEKFCFTYSSQHVFDVLGYEPAELIGHSVFEYMTSESASEIQKQAQQNSQNHVGFQLQISTLIHKNGTHVFIETSGNPLIDTDGNFYGNRGISRDITRRQKLFNSVEESNTLLERVFENTHSLIAYIDNDFNFVRVNRAYARADNKHPAELVGKNHFDLYPNDENQKIFQEVLKTGQTHFSYARPFEYGHNPEKGITHWDWSLQPVPNEENQTIGLLLVLVDVTKRIDAQQALMRNEDTLNQAQSIAHFGSWDWNILTNQLDWTDEIYRIFGHVPQSFPPTYNTFLDAIHIDDQSKVIEAVDAAVANRNSIYHIEHRVVRPDGEIRIVNERGQVYRDDNDRPIRMIGTVQDITQTRLINDELKTKDIAIQRSISAIAMAGVDTKLTFVNAAFLETWGYTSEQEVLGRSALEFWKDRQEVEAFVGILLAEGKAKTEMTAIKKDGSEACIHVSANITPDANGKPLNLMASFVDITEQKQIAADLAQSKDLLTKAQELAHLGSWEWEVQNNKLKWSDETYRIFGQDPKTFNCNYENFLQTIHENDRNTVTSVVQATLDSPDKEYRVEHRINRPNGDERTVVEQGIVYRDPEGNATRMVGAVLDITDQKNTEREIRELNHQLEQRVQQRTEELENSLLLLRKENEARKEVELSLVRAKEEAEKANKLKSDFLGRMSHELRTPMNAILGFGQLLDEEVSGRYPKEYVAELMRASQHLMGMIDEVLDLSKIESGKLQLTYEHVSLYEIVQESIALTQAFSEKHKITIENTVADQKIYINVDRVRMKEVITNLITNAIKYNSEDGKVLIESRPVKNNTVRISVTDNGQGIAPSDQELIFEPFNRIGQEYSSIEGAGIGLSIVKQLIGMMDGTIGLESTNGKGSTFWVECPIAKRPALRTTKETSMTLKSDTNTKTVLYIEDNPANLRLVERIAEQIPQIVFLSAPNAELGLELARKKIPDLILLDLNLPGMDGYEALSRLRNFPETTNINAVALSAAATPRDIERGLLAGFKRYLTKPLQISILREVLASELGLATESGQPDKQA